MFDPNDQIGKTIELSAKLFAMLADEVLKECGEERGAKIVRSAVRKYGQMRAETIKENIQKDGKEVTFETVEQYSDYPENHAWECTSEISGNTLREVNTICPFATAFREVGLERAGRLYCEEIDLALNQTLFGDITFERPRLFTDGADAPCEMVVTKLF